MITFKQLLEQLRNPKEIKTFKSRVSHMKDVDSRDQSWQMTLEDLFAKFGFKQLGSGKFGTVFGHPNYPYIIKVFMRDTAFLRWLEFAKKNQNNPLVPKIRGKVVKIGNLFMAVRMEKLTEPTLKMKYWDEDEDDPNVSQVLDFFDKNSKLLDLHMGNIMARGNQPVIIDPFYNWYKGGRYVIDPDDISDFKAILS